jgi:hypothetical protein
VLQKLSLFVAGITQWTTRRRLGVLVICGDVAQMTAGHMSWVVVIGHCLPCKVRSEVRIWGKLHCPRALSQVPACSIELCRSLLSFILLYDVDAVHELSVGCKQGRLGINIIMDLFATFRLLKSIGPHERISRPSGAQKHQRTWISNTEDLPTTKNLTPKLLLLKWNIRDERQDTVEQTIKKEHVKMSKTET